MKRRPRITAAQRFMMHRPEKLRSEAKINLDVLTTPFEFLSVEYANAERDIKAKIDEAHRAVVEEHLAYLEEKFRNGDFTALMVSKTDKDKFHPCR